VTARHTLKTWCCAGISIHAKWLLGKTTNFQSAPLVRVNLHSVGMKLPSRDSPQTLEFALRNDLCFCSSFGLYGLEISLKRFELSSLAAHKMLKKAHPIRHDTPSTCRYSSGDSGTKIQAESRTDLFVRRKGWLANPVSVDHDYKHLVDRLRSRQTTPPNRDLRSAGPGKQAWSRRRCLHIDAQ
jgi:hypothetical protein